MLRILVAFALTLSSIGFAKDSSDRECRVFITGAAWASYPGAFDLTVRTPNREQFAAPSTVKALMRFHGGEWREINLVAERVDDRFRYYSARYRPAAGGHPSMTFDVIAFIETNGDRIFDHNWHDGTDGFVRLERANNWTALNLSSRCVR